MYAVAFDYYRATSIADLQRLLDEHPGAKLLAGGHSLIPLLKLRLAAPAAVIDIGRIAQLRGISVNDRAVRIGALTTHAELAASPALRDACPILADAAAVIGDPQVRNRGTIGGNAAHADPAADLPTVLVALEARFTLTGPKGDRPVEASDFFRGVMATALAENEILTAIDVPARQPGQGMAYVKFAHPASRYAVVGSAAVVTLASGKCIAARVAVGGLVAKPTRAPSVEAALVGNRLAPEIVSQAAAKIGQDLGDDIQEDLFASAEYRKAMAVVYTRRALMTAAQRAA